MKHLDLVCSKMHAYLDTTQEGNTFLKKKKKHYQCKFFAVFIYFIYRQLMLIFIAPVSYPCKVWGLLLKGPTNTVCRELHYIFFLFFV